MRRLLAWAAVILMAAGVVFVFLIALYPGFVISKGEHLIVPSLGGGYSCVGTSSGSSVGTEVCSFSDEGGCSVLIPVDPKTGQPIGTTSTTCGWR